MFSKFIETEKHKNAAWQMEKRLHEASAAIDDRLRQQYNDPEVLQLVRYSLSFSVSHQSASVIGRDVYYSMVVS